MSRARSPKPTAVAIAALLNCSFLATALPVVAAEPGHSVCPDYAEYRDLLNDGQMLLDTNNSGKAPDLKRDYFDDGASRRAARTLTSLQYAIMCAEAEEQSSDFDQALKWWNGVLSTVAKAQPAAPEEQDNEARVHSRLGDIYLALSHPDVHETSLRDSDWKREAWAVSRYQTHLLSRPSVATVVPISVLTHARIEKILDLMSNQSGPVAPKTIEKLKLALSQYRASVENRKTRADAASTIFCVFDLIKCAAIQHRLGDRSGERQSMHDALRAFLGASRMDNDAPDLVSPTQTSEKQSPTYNLEQRNLVTVKTRKAGRGPHPSSSPITESRAASNTQTETSQAKIIAEKLYGKDGLGSSPGSLGYEGELGGGFKSLRRLPQVPQLAPKAVLSQFHPSLLEI